MIGGKLQEELRNLIWKKTKSKQMGKADNK